MRNLRTMISGFLALASATFFLSGVDFSVAANNTPQTLPFAQNWTANVITTADDWSPVNGIVGFRGDSLTTLTGVDPRTIISDGSATPVDVNANQTDPNTFTSGGVAEFDTLANPVVALQGSGTADAPFLVVYLNTTGQSNVRVQYNARDIDGSADNAVQWINTQYRVGGTGDYINLPGGFIPDASTGPSEATLVTPVDVTLPPAANNQPVVEVRIMTTNVFGSDEWIGIDDISVTTTGTPARNRTNADYDGDGRTDYVVTRDTDTPVSAKGGSNEAGLTQKYWYFAQNGTNAVTILPWGVPNDVPVAEDFDGDGKDDVAVWRPAPAPQAAFYILNSSNFTLTIQQFGQNGDDISVVGDYDGDRKADPASFRCPIGSQGQCTWYYRGSLNNPAGNVTFVPWGFGDTNAESPNAAPGDFDGDGKFDFNVRMDVDGQGTFVLLRSSDFGVEWIPWGLPTDAEIPGDYDGDGRHDFAVGRIVGNLGNLYILESDGGGTGASPIVIADPTTDALAPGDYDGDGSQDIAVWRPNADPTQNYFWVRRSSNGSVYTYEWGQNGDRPVAEWLVEGGD